jgi:predicted nicotinamide N-methyase
MAQRTTSMTEPTTGTMRRFFQTLILLLLLVVQLVASFSVDGRTRPILRTLTLVDETTETRLGQCQELAPFPEEADKPDEDDLEVLYPTARRFFQFGKAAAPCQVRTTSFGCGKLGHQVWSSSLALCLLLSSHPQKDKIENQRVLELGAGCGLPSVVCRDVLGATSVVATDFWMEAEDALFDKDRLVPEVWHGINLQFNVDQKQPRAKAQRLDWHDLDSVRQCQADIVVGSDLIYYPMDLEPLWNTMEILLHECGAKEILLVSPLQPDTREAFPAFRQLLEAKSKEGFRVEMEELSLYKDEQMREESKDRFLKMSIRKE